MNVLQIAAADCIQARHSGFKAERLAAAMQAQGLQCSLASLLEDRGEWQGDPVKGQSFYETSWPHELGISPGLRRMLRSTQTGLIHHHGVCVRTLHYAHESCSRQGIPLVVSPAGQLSRRRWAKESMRMRLSQLLMHPGAYRACRGWHVERQEEKEELASLGFRQPVCVAAPGLDAPSPAEIEASKSYWNALCPELAQHKVALFYSRFHSNRRILELIDTWLAQAPKDWVLLMVGFPHEYGAAQISDYVMRCSGTGRVLVFDARNTPPPYPLASLFLLPAQASSSQRAVSEALVYGLPLLVTDEASWAHLNETDFAWCGPWEQFAGVLKESLSLGRDALSERGLQAAAWGATHCSWNKTAAILADFYKSLAP